MCIPKESSYDSPLLLTIKRAEIICSMNGNGSIGGLKTLLDIVDSKDLKGMLWHQRRMIAKRSGISKHPL